MQDKDLRNKSALISNMQKMKRIPKNLLSPLSSALRSSLLGDCSGDSALQTKHRLRFIPRPLWLTLTFVVLVCQHQ